MRSLTRSIFFCGSKSAHSIRLIRPDASRSDSEADDPPDWNFLIGIELETCDQTASAVCHARCLYRRDQGARAQFAPGRSARSKAPRHERRPRAIDGLNISQINPDGDRACTLARPFFSKLDEPPAIEFWDPQPLQSVFKKGEAHPFGTTNAFADPLQVFAMQLDQIAECFRVAGASRDCGFPRSMRRSTSSAHSSASFRRKNVSLTYFPFRRTWARQDSELSLENVAKTCALRVR